MRIIGHGVDIVSVGRIEEMLREHGERFKERCFTASERAYADGRRNEGEVYAARFAAKEAVLKALGKGLSDGISWTEIEVARSAGGQPSINVTGRAATVAREMGVGELVVSLSHADGVAMASVIAVGSEVRG